MTQALTVNVETEAKSETAPSGVTAAETTDKTTRVQVDPANGMDKKKPTEEKKKFAGKYETTEELEAAYLAAQVKLSEKAPADDKKKSEPTTPDAARAAVEKAGLDITALNEEYLANDALSENTLNALEAKGISKATVEAYIAGQKARVAEYGKELHKAAGGEEKFTRMLEWAGANLSEGEVKAVNAALASFDPAAAKIALSGLSARYTASVGSDPQLVTGGEGVRNVGIKPFGSNEEIQRAMSDRRYKEGDQAYHAEVEKRLMATETFSIRSL